MKDDTMLFYLPKLLMLFLLHLKIDTVENVLFCVCVDIVNTSNISLKRVKCKINSN